MKVDLVARVSIDANQALVFKYLTNLKYHFLWNPPLHTIKPIKVLKKGDQYESTSMLLGIKVHGLNRVTKLVPQKELELQNQAGLVSYLVNFKLTTVSGKTVILCKTSVSSDGTAFAFAKPALKLLAKRELQSDLKALKIAVEQRLE